MNAELNSDVVMASYDTYVLKYDFSTDTITRSVSQIFVPGPRSREPPKILSNFYVHFRSRRVFFCVSGCFVPVFTRRTIYATRDCVRTEDGADQKTIQRLTRLCTVFFINTQLRIKSI